MTTSAAGSWRGPAARPNDLRWVVTGGSVVVLVVLCLVPLAPRGLHAGVVLVVLAAALVAAAWPRPERQPMWRIDASGVTTWSPGDSTAHLPADRYDAVAFGRGRDTARADPDGRTGPPGRDRLYLAATAGGGPPRVVHQVELDRAGTPFALCEVARDVGLRRLLPPGARDTVERDERRLADLLATARPAGTAPPAEPVVVTDPADAGIARTVAVRCWFGGLGVALVAALAAPVGDTWSGRVGATLGVLLALVALPRLARGRQVRSALRWRIGHDGLEVVDTDLGSWRFTADAVGAVVVTSADDPGHGRGPRSAALVVDPAGRPVAELPLRSRPPSDVVGPLRAHGFRVLVAELEPWDVRGGLATPG